MSDDCICNQLVSLVSLMAAKYECQEEQLAEKIRHEPQKALDYLKRVAAFCYCFIKVDNTYLEFQPIAMSRRAPSQILLPRHNRTLAEVCAHDYGITLKYPLLQCVSYLTDCCGRTYVPLEMVYVHKYASDYMP